MHSLFQEALNMDQELFQKQFNDPEAIKITGFDIEIFGLNFSRLDFEKNNFCVLLFHNLSITNNRPIKAISKNIQDQEIFSNSYII